MREALSDTSPPLKVEKRTLSPEERRESARRRNKTHYYKNLPYYKVRSYRDFDKKRELPGSTLSVEEFANLLKEHPKCHFCEGTEVSTLGLDRIDNSRSHELTNVVICCEKCNNILGDIPFDAKLELKEGLMEIHKKELLNNWTVPTKRKPK